MKNVNNVANAMKDGKYLEHEICACSGNRGNMWVIVFDAPYNYMLFPVTDRAIKRAVHKQLPCNKVSRSKMTEFYSTFDNALKNLVKVVANNGFLTRSRVV